MHGYTQSPETRLRPELVGNLLNPSNVVIVGATPREGGWPDAVFKNLTGFGYGGDVFLVNPNRSEIWGHACYPSIAELPDRPDHLAVLVPAERVIDAVSEGIKAGCRSATVFASGFGEGGDPEGLKRREALAELVAESGLALCGPNCLGNLSASTRSITLTDRLIKRVNPGPVALVGQSGGVVLFLHSAMRNRGLDVSYAVSSGNELGLNAADYISYCVEDPQVKVVVTFIEAISSAETFIAACDKAKQLGKPIIAVKVGGSAAARAAAAAHTGALAGTLGAFDAVASQHGVIRVDTLEEAVELAEYLGHARLPVSRGVAATVYSGGLRELLHELAEPVGLEFPTLAKSTRDELEAVFPVGTNVGNPLDSGWGSLSSPQIFFQSVDALLSDPSVGAVLVQERLPAGPGEPRSEEYIAGLEERAREPGCKPIAVFSMVHDSVTDYGCSVRDTAPHLPFFQGASGTVKALAAVMRYIEAGRSDAPPPAAPPALGAAGPGALSEAEAKSELARYGLPVPREAVAVDEASVLAAADDIGYPVVLKGILPGVVHKSDVGLVKLALADAAQVRVALDEIRAAAALVDSSEGALQILVASYARDGFDAVLGWQVDPEMGPVVMFGWGGVVVELLRDVVFIPAPTTEAAARAALMTTKAGAVLNGYRGGQPYDVDFVVDAIVKTGRMAAEESSRISAVDINPLRVWGPGQGGVILDAAIILSGPAAPPGTRRKA